MEAADKPLAGRHILVPESRELDIFARMLEERGAVAARCPLVTINDLEDPAPVEAWLQRLVADEFDDLILLTGEGLRRLMAVAQRTGIETQALAALKQLRTITRGPKPARVLRELGLAPGLAAEAPTTAGVIATLQREDISGRTVGVQLYPGNPNGPLLDFLRGAGATAAAIVPYRYASDAESAQVDTAIRGMAAGQFDAVAFTSTPQIERLEEVAQQHGIEAELRQGLARVLIAAVGPVVASALTKRGFHVAAMPASSFHLKPMVNALVEALSSKSSRT
ncbi:MAG TPA: uroporphyrinogen-III synthase [Stellaceae bacterium]|jgi:uroporphyrinogen-III synthase|nr:uroporphyrinogen-III synthase [Stellaceae bacterium]